MMDAGREKKRKREGRKSRKRESRSFTDDELMMTSGHVDIEHGMKL